MIITVFVHIKKVSHLPSQLGIFVFMFTVKRFHIYGALLHLALKVFTFTGPYYIFTFRGATWADQLLHQLLMQQFDTSSSQCRHIDYMVQNNIFDNLIDMKTWTIFP